MVRTHSRRLRDEAEAVIASGALGRSDTYPALLRYLVERTVSGRTPKELEIAIDVFDRDSDFDVARDSLVRVYIHKLRQKLDAHYASNPGSPRLQLPRGRYLVVLEDAGEGAAERGRGRWRGGAAAAAVLLAMLAAFAAGRIGAPAPQAQPVPAAADTPLWAPLLSDREPITLVLGDVFVFAELNRDYEVVREIRQFGVRDREALERYAAHRGDDAPAVRPLDSTWLPPGTVRGIDRLLPLLRAGGAPVRIALASELRDGLPERGHTVFVGPMDTLGQLTEPTFAPSRFMLHPSAELLVDRATAEIHLREGLPDRPYSERYVDFALASRRTASHGGRVLVLAAVGDAALVRLVDALTDPADLRHADGSLRAAGVAPDGDLELLYEVVSADGGLGASLRHAGALPYEPDASLPDAPGAAAQSTSQ